MPAVYPPPLHGPSPQQDRIYITVWPTMAGETIRLNRLEDFKNSLSLDH
jgi:hypothetical protein